jgi:hypothetical protein
MRDPDPSYRRSDVKVKAFRLLIAMATIAAMAVALGAGTRWT